MKIKNNKRYILSFFVILFILFSLVNVSAILTKTWVFNTTEDFDKGYPQNINTSFDRLVVSSDITTFNYLWVANSGEGSVSKIDTDLNKEVARYYTGSHEGLNYASGGEWPSRTAVDSKGNVWIGNRAGDKTLVKIAGHKSSCVDRNNNDMIDTSYDANNNGSIEWVERYLWNDTEGISNDECVLLAVKPWGESAVRGIVEDSDKNIWAGLSDMNKYVKLNPDTGELISEVSTPNHSSYGAVIDKNGILWSSSRIIHSLAKINTQTNTLIGIYTPNSTICPTYGFYGIAVDKNNNIWIGNYEGQGLIKMGSDGSTLGCYNYSGVAGVNDMARGVTVDRDGNIWYASSASSYVYEFNPTTETWGCVLYTDYNPIGIVEDSKGFIWAIGTGTTGPAFKINNSACGIVTNVGTGVGPYTYSDATGSLLFQNIKEGFWIANLDTKWAKWWVNITWLESNKKDGNLSVEKKDLNDGDFSEVINGRELDVDSLLLSISVTIKRNSDETSPILESLVIKAGCSNISDKETNCGNGLDEDCDDLIDYQDTDCINNEACLSIIDNISKCNDWSQHTGYLCGWKCVNGNNENCPPNPNIIVGNCSACMDIPNMCFGYNNNVTCNKDPCYKKEFDCSLFSCDVNKNYYCYWDINKNTCGFYSNINNGFCNYTGEFIRKCGEGINIGIINYTGEPPEDCPSKTIRYSCPKTVKLPFFNTISIIVIVVLIVLFYYFYVNSRKRSC